MKKKNLLNHKFGRLLVIKAEPSDKNGNACWLCRCNCGNHVIVTGARLQHGITKSCGCLRRDVMQKRTHSNAILIKNSSKTDSFLNDDGVCYNSLKRSSRNKSGHISVSYDQDSGKWFARLMFRNHYVLLKSFDTMDEAIQARMDAEKRFFPKKTRSH